MTLYVTYAIEDDGTRREIDRHENYAYAKSDLCTWRFANPGVEIILVDHNNIGTDEYHGDLP